MSDLVNTVRADFVSQGMNHCEGGWPKMMESCIKQNNAIEIYEEYFTETDEATDCEEPKAKTVNLFRDYESCNGWNRPVSSIAWCPDGERLAITYCNLEFQAIQPGTPKTSFIFHIDDPTHPDVILNPPFHVVSSEFSPRDVNLLAGGCYNGQVCWWDGRKGGKPEGEISLDNSHTEPVYKTKWVSSKTGTEFFTASTDGMVLWWDIRKFVEPLESLILDPCGDKGSLSKAQGASCIEYEPTIPTKFMVGTEQGNVFSCNRKAKTSSERIVGIYKAHFGPVYALERNPCFPKNFLTVGDWCARIWSEDIKESAIMWTSVQDGVLDTWDILYQQRTPILSTKIADDPINCVKIHEQGCLVAIGCNNGSTSIIELSESLSVSQKNEKASVTAMFERETRREKILEARNKEIRLKEKTKGILGLGGGGGR
ncbi:dynein intermediate chain 3, ciliary [Eurytemora carolleeae]|uniref:dynein intermediate chain 3, ciliary n=1 Tax=Eurytemora carolleeae TaxID=1294199 RepID=UPI000C78EE40|nr:dynein intermediate chain 3, ciliary [Eurytemora carolleeae]|eukprot:XP_023346915.1 dynein intermediate chain 3, ciliary-like [Eurytemora affinis]